MVKNFFNGSYILNGFIICVTVHNLIYNGYDNGFTEERIELYKASSNVIQS